MLQGQKLRFLVMQPDPSLAFTRRTAADALGVSLRTIDALLATGALRARRIGRRVLIPKTELMRFLNADAAVPQRSRDGQ